MFTDQESEENYEDTWATAIYTDIFVAIFPTGQPFRSWVGCVWPPGLNAIHAGPGVGLVLTNGDVYLVEGEVEGTLLLGDTVLAGALTRAWITGVK